MTTELTAQSLPTDPQTGLTLPLKTLLGSQALAKHRAMLALELEVMAKKVDRFGWDRDRGTAAHDRLITDWMDALADYPLQEVQDACRAWVKKRPEKMANEGGIVGLILSARRERVAAHKARLPAQPEPRKERCAPEVAAEIVRSANFHIKRFG